MTKYIQSESLKFKKTFSKKLIFIAPLITALMAFVMGPIHIYQVFVVYWWYSFMMSGVIALFSALSNQKEERADRYYSIYSQPLDLKKIWSAKVLVVGLFVLLAGLIIGLFAGSINLIQPGISVFNLFQLSLCVLGTTVTSLWQIPLCLFTARKWGLFIPIVINFILGIFGPILFGSKAYWWICPYTWTSKLQESLMGIKVNGEFTSGSQISITGVVISLSLSIICFVVLLKVTANKFAKQEAK